MTYPGMPFPKLYQAADSTDLNSTQFWLTPLLNEPYRPLNKMGAVRNLLLRNTSPQPSHFYTST